MYQVIDDQDEEDLAPAARFSVLPFIIGAILAALVFFLVWLMSPGQKTAPGQSIDTPASRSAYLSALSEPQPALRRARLLDFQRVYPDSDRKGAIAAQLDIINAAELRDWDVLVQAVYDDRLPRADKDQAMAQYETRWNGRLLGGRAVELAEIRELLDQTKTTGTPDRSLDPGESPIPEEIPSDILAGAPPRMAVTFPIPEPEPEPEPEVIVPKDIIVPPSVRRNSSPNYPRAARRRNIGAVVVVSMDLNEEGKVESVDTVSIQAERYERDFRRAAERAAKRTRFNPKTINGKAVPAKGVHKRYIFRVK